ncbi:endonuclease/exonuclease/phosphatase family protein, partial [Candidatus Sumerlaeota bacterium]|nr:endonuclease/exonuclease/phosphatase family protein [Candidatus Sumerlaeota bacterium]
ERYRLVEHYSGVPSTTPAVQGELFYGVKASVPAFSFRMRETGEVVRMFDREPAEEIQKRLASQGIGLLQGGSCYSDIYDGGSKESHFCPATWGWGNLLDAVNPFILAGLIAAHAWSLVRIAVLFIVEYLLAVTDFFRGIIAGHNLFAELKFIPARTLICIVLRELICIGASMDIARGLDVVHLNFVGYDEQAHRRGPSSRFAHWSLKGIDAAIGRLWKLAHRSLTRDYQVWIYSDHGQEETNPYTNENGRTIHEAVAEIFGEMKSRGELQPNEKGIESERVRWVGGKRIRRRFAKRETGRQEMPIPSGELSSQSLSSGVKVAAMGPLGHVYSPHPLSSSDKERFANELIARAHVPLVLAADGPDAGIAWTAEGKFKLPKEEDKILGSDHPFLEETSRDLTALCHHPYAGDLILSGWRLGKKPISFPHENGAHAGPGSEETRAFALLPSDAPVKVREGNWIRPGDLHEAALLALGRLDKPFYIHTTRTASEPRTLRLMTYNVHSCVGMDGRISMTRIARVIMQSDPDVVALQELDVGRARTGGHDQAHEIARHLEMDFHFHPAIHLEEERYGDAILSRLPMRMIRSAPLPTLSHRPRLEPRGAIWVEIEVDGHKVHLLNTHLGLLGRERRKQVEGLLGGEWLGHPDCVQPAILCGDFNALPKMDAYRRLIKGRLRDVQREMNGHRPRNTWFGKVPIGRIDHIFTTPGIEVVRIEVVRSDLARMASDHLPLVAELRLT